MVLFRPPTYPWKAIVAISLGASYWQTYSEKSPSRFLGIFTIACLTQTLAYAIWAILLYPTFFSSLIGLPEPSGSSWWNGQFPAISEKPSGAPQIEWVNNLKHDGIIRYRAFLNQERLLIVGPKALSEVLVTKSYDFEKPASVRLSIGRILGHGVLLVEGDEHKFQRRNLMPAFSFRHVKDLYPVFWAKAREGVLAMTVQLGSELKKKGEEKEEDIGVLEVSSWASRITLDIIGVAGMGRDFGAIKNPDNHLAQVYRRILKPNRQAQVLALMGLILPQWFVGNLPVSRNNDMMEAGRQIREVCMDLIKEKKEKLSRNKLKDVDILSVALESGAFTENSLVDQVMTFLAAGHETTGSAMTWAIYLLCTHPDVQTRLRNEVRENLPSLGDLSAAASVGALEIDRLPYLNAVVNEVLRYFPPVPLTVRDAAVDTVIQGVKIPRGTRIIICPWATNKDTSLWGDGDGPDSPYDAAKFIPERWIPTGTDPKKDRLAGNGGASSNFAYSTFIHGPRSCIGMGFAKAEFACILAAWIGRIEFKLKNKEEMDEKNVLIKGGITAKPAKGLHVVAKILDGW